MLSAQETISGTVQYSTVQYSTGDYLRFYDETGVLGQSGTRYCFSDSPAFTYTTNIKVLFKTNNDGTTGKGNYAGQRTELLTL